MLIVIFSLNIAFTFSFLLNHNDATYFYNRRLNNSEIESEEYVPFKYKPRPKIIIDEQQKIRTRNFDQNDNIITVAPLISISPKKRANNIAYNSIDHLVSCCRNKLITLYSTTGCLNWHYKINNIAPCEEYYAVCLTCTWDDRSKAFLQTIKQMHGYQKIDRDPPFSRKKPPPLEFNDLLKEYLEEKKIYEDYIAMKKLCLKEGKEPPQKPDFRPVVTFKKTYPYDHIQSKVLDYVETMYRINYLEPDYWRLVFNKHFNKMYNMFYNEMNNRIPDNKTLNTPCTRAEIIPTNNILVNFVLAPITDSQLIKNKNKLNRVFKRKMYSHAKKIIYHEIILRLLVENDIKYSDMPVVFFYKLNTNTDYSMLSRKSGSEALAAAQLLDYKCKKLIQKQIFNPENFELICKLDGFDKIKPPPSEELDALLSQKQKVELPWKSTPLDPLVSHMYISYQYHLRKLIDDAKPKFYYQILHP